MAGAADIRGGTGLVDCARGGLSLRLGWDAPRALLAPTQPRRDQFVVPWATTRRLSAAHRFAATASGAWSRVNRIPLQHWTAQRKRIGDTGGRRATAHEAMAPRSRSHSPVGRGRSPKAKPSSERAPAARDLSATVVGVRISHPDRVIYPDLEISKIQFCSIF